MINKLETNRNKVNRKEVITIVSETEVISGRGQQVGSKSLVPARVINEPLVGQIQYGEDAYTEDWWMPAHQHENSHLVLCLSGVVEHHAGKDSFLVAERSVGYVPAHETHSNRFRGNVHIFQITIDESNFGIALNQSKSTSLHPHQRSGSLMNSILREFRSPDKYSQLMLVSLTTELLVSIHRQEEARCATNCRVPWLLQVRDLLHDELYENLQLEYIAGKVGVHPAHLTKAFRQHFGQSIGEYVRALRISRARHLLETSDLPIGEIAFATGFIDQSHFTRTFKRHTGQTPHSYRTDH